MVHVGPWLTRDWRFSICRSVTPFMYPSLEEISFNSLWAGGDSFTSACVVNRLPSRSFVRNTKTWKTLGPLLPTGLVPTQWLEVRDYPAYSAKLMVSDFHLFGSLTKHLAGKRFTADADMKHSLISLLQTLESSLFEAGVHSLVPRWDRRINVNCDYFADYL